MRNKILLTVLLLVLSTISFGQVAEPSRPMIQRPDGNLVDDAHPQPVAVKSGDITIDNVTVEAFPVYKDGAGDPATSELDAETRVRVNLQAEAIGLITALEDIKNANASETNLVAAIDLVVAAIETAQQLITDNKAVALSPTEQIQFKHTLVANTAYTITNPYPMGNVQNKALKYIEVKTQDPESEFWASVDGSTDAVIGEHRPCMGRFYIETQVDEISIIASTSFDIFIIQGVVPTAGSL
jgi:hypothetical protein